MDMFEVHDIFSTTYTRLYVYYSHITEDMINNEGVT